MTSQQGLTIQKYSLLTKCWLVDVLKVLSDLDISKGKKEYSFEWKNIKQDMKKNGVKEYYIYSSSFQWENIKYIAISF